MKLKEIQNLTKAKLEGDPDYSISSIAAMPNQAQEDQLAMIFAHSFNKADKLLKNCKAKALLISEDLYKDPNFQKNYFARFALIVKRPKYALQILISYFAKPKYQPSGIDSRTAIDPSAQIGTNVRIGVFSCIGANTKIGANSIIHPRVSIGANVKIGENCEIKTGTVIEDDVQIGNRVIIHPNAVIGSDGYSYITEEPSNLEKLQRNDMSFNLGRQIQHKILSIGSVIVGNDVEIGANTCIDRGNIANTIIGDGTKIDNLCQIAHNVKIGKDCLIIAQTGIAGSAIIEDRVTMAGSSGCADGVTIGNDAVVAAFSAVNSNVDPFMPVIGAPAIAYGEFMRRQRAIARLPRQQEELRKIKIQLGNDLESHKKD